MAERTAHEQAPDDARAAAADDDQKAFRKEPVPPRDWNDRAATLLECYDNSSDPALVPELADLLARLYNEERTRLADVRKDPPKLETRVFTRLEFHDFVRLVNHVYGIGDEGRTRQRILTKLYHSRIYWRHNVHASRVEGVVDRHYILTGHCPFLLAPRDTQDNFDLEILFIDLCFRGYLEPGHYCLVID